MKRSLLLALGMLLGVGLIGGLAFFVRSSAAPVSLFKSTVLSPREPASELVLPSTLGHTVSLRDYRGKVVLLYFGYTFCPDVCPTTVADIKRTFDLLGAQASQVQFLMVTIDPERDTPEKFGKYLNYFNPNFIGLYGRMDETYRASFLFGARYYKHDGTAATGYLMDHTAWVLVIDPEGYNTLHIPFGLKPQDIADDLKLLLSQK